MSGAHPASQEIQALVDNRLSESDRRRLEQHLSDCQPCQAERNRVESARQLLHSAFEDREEVPEEVRFRVASALQRETSRRRQTWRLPVSLAAAAVLIIAIVLLIQQRTADLPAETVKDYQSVVSGEIPLELATSDPVRLEKWFDQQLGFPSRVFDLAMMGYQLAGGRIDSVAGKPAALFVYRHASGQIVICEMYQGNTARLPTGAERRQHNGIEFFVYARNGSTAVFWQEGTVVCVMAGDVGKEEIISLAFAKAMRAVSKPDA